MKSSTFWALSCLFLLVWALYGRVVEYDFVNFDDPGYVYENPHVVGGLTGENIQWAFEIHGPSMWVPLTWLSHQAVVEVFGMDPGPHHGVNVLLHAINVVLLAGLMMRLGIRWILSVLLAAIWAIHPLHVESVAWVTERKDVLCLLFCLIAFHGWIYFRRETGRRRWWWFALVGAGHLLAVMAKPMAVTLPFILLLMDYLPGWNPKGYPKLRQALQPMILLPFSVLSSWLTILCQQEAGALSTVESISLAMRLGNAVNSLVLYLQRWLFPWDLAAFYPYPESLDGIQVGLSLALLLVLTLLLLWKIKRWPGLLVGWLWFGGSMVPMLGLVQAGSAAMADRYAYLPVLGLYLGIGIFFSKMRQPHDMQGVAGFYRMGGWLVVLVWSLHLLFIQTGLVGVWKNSGTLFRHALEVTRENHLAHNNYGLYLKQAGDIDGARHHFEASLRAEPSYREALNNLGILEAGQGNWLAAEGILWELLRIYPDSHHGWHNLGKVYQETGRFAQAVEAFRRSIELNPRFVEPRYDLGWVLLASGDLVGAEESFGQLLLVQPDHINAWINLGVTLFQQQRYQEAREAYLRAAALDPQNPLIKENLSRF